jgi:hypothetical protein
MTNETETGRCFEIEITPEMLSAGTDALILDSEAFRSELALAVIVAALEAGGYNPSQSPR